MQLHKLGINIKYNKVFLPLIMITPALLFSQPKKLLLSSNSIQLPCQTKQMF